MVFFDLEWHEQSKNDYYLAQIALEIRLFREAFMTNPKAVSLKDSFIKFIKEGEELEEEVEEELTPEEVEKLRKKADFNSKCMFMGLGIPLPTLESEV